MKKRILIVDDEKSIRLTLKSFLSEEGYEVYTAEDFDGALLLLTEKKIDLIFADIILGGSTGIDFLREVRGRNLNCPVIMITGYPNIETATEAVRLGAFDYLPKPVLKKDILHVTGLALQYKEMADRNEKYRLNLEAIFRSVKDAIITVDNELSIVEINEAAEKICEYSRDVIGRSFNTLTHNCSGTCYEAVMETIRKKQPVEMCRISCNHKDNQGQVVTITTSPLLDQSGVFSGAVLVVRDETRLATLERDMGERYQFHNIIGKSRQMQEIFFLIEDLADVQTTVLVTGESGTGKEMIAEALHYKGLRCNKPLVKVNCSALSENLLESELFGHVKGAFTGAIKDKAGRFQRADGGTIFLDEIGSMSPGMQLRLLRVLQEREFERVGDSTPVKVDARVIAATNQPLLEKVKRGEFREDLYYRLKVVEIVMPPLRERREDIPLLIEHFTGKFSAKFNKKILMVSDDVRKIFMEYPWTGNIRELEHAVEHAFILCHDSTIMTDHLPPELRNYVSSSGSLADNTEYSEQERIISALEKTAWNKARAARVLGIDRKTLYRKLEKYNIANQDDKS